MVATSFRNARVWVDSIPPGMAVKDVLNNAAQEADFYFDNSGLKIYICTDGSTSAQVWGESLTSSQIQALIPNAQIQSDWTQSNSASLDFIKNKPSSRSQSSASRSLNSVFQISSTRDCFANYSVDIATSLSLTTGQSGTVFLEIASDSGFTSNVQELARFVNGQTGTLTIGLALTQNVTGTLSGYVPPAYYVRLRTQNNTGTPTFTYRSGQEVLL